MSEIRINKFPVEITSSFDRDEVINLAGLQNRDDVRNSRVHELFISNVLLNYFRELDSTVLVSSNFISNINVWIQSSFVSENIIKYESYNLVVRSKDFKDKIESTVSISYDGEKSVYNKDINQLTGQELSLVRNFLNVDDKVVVRKEDISADNKILKPLLSRELKEEVGYKKVYRNPRDNHFKKNIQKIYSFYQDLLLGVNFKNKVNVFKSGFSRVNISDISSTKKTSNELIFGDKRTNFNVYSGIKLHGPYANCPNQDKVKFIFVFNDKLKSHANKLFLHLKKGYKNFPGIKEFIGVPFFLDAGSSISYTDQDPSDTIKRKLDELNLDHNTFKYIAVYITEHDKHDQNLNVKNIYYRVKEILLENSITSQAVSAKSIEAESFNYFLPNISIAILAKLGGKPWLINTVKSNSLVVGIGAIKSGGKVYLGNTIAFNSKGDFLEFDAFEQTSIDDLVTVIKKSLSDTINNWGDGYKTLIIHLYKEMNKRERNQLEVAMSELELQMPYVVLNVSEDRSNLAFDEEFDGKIPVSGTVVRLNARDYLLYNNTRYSERTKSKIESFSFPVKVRFSKSKHIDISSDTNREFLIDQVYQFSRIYWKSVRQRSLPVTVEYSKILADMVSNFESESLPDNDTAKKSLWFL